MPYIDGMGIVWPLVGELGGPPGNPVGKQQPLRMKFDNARGDYVVDHDCQQPTANPAEDDPRVATDSVARAIIAAGNRVVSAPELPSDPIARGIVLAGRKAREPARG